MITYSGSEGLIKPCGIKKLDGTRDRNYELPHIAVGVFSEYLLEDIVEKFECTKVGVISCANCRRPIYIMKYENIKITLFLAGVSGPWISADIEELSLNGVNTFIIFGNCGVLDRKIEDCSIIIPNKAFRDEGTSYHYLPDSEFIEMNEEYKHLFKQVLIENDYKYEEGATWTTDAFYRETKEKMRMFQKKGAICVEMEGAAIAAVCTYKGLKYFTFYYAGDNLDAVEWEERSISQLTNFEKKARVPCLAFELARKIENQENIELTYNTNKEKEQGMNAVKKYRYTYNKLVRDKIPENIDKEEGRKCKYRILNDEEYLEELNRKVLEEANEFIEENSIEELGDLMEVINAIMKLKGYKFEEVEKVMKAKEKKKGAFYNKIFLEYVDEEKRNIAEEIELNKKFRRR